MKHFACGMATSSNQPNQLSSLFVCQIDGIEFHPIFLHEEAPVSTKIGLSFLEIPLVLPFTHKKRLDKIDEGEHIQ